MRRPVRSLIARALRLVVPSAWRQSVRRDLADEAAALRRGVWWQAWHLLGTGLRLRAVRGASAIAADFRYSFRSLLHARGFAATAVLTFALGIGVNVAVLSVVDRLMFRPLPFPEPDRLVQIHESARPTAGGVELSIQTVAARRLRDQSTAIASLTYFAKTQSVTVDGLGEDALRLVGVPANVLDVLGIAPVLGLGFTPDADRSEVEVLLSYATWQNRYGGNLAPELFTRVHGTGGKRLRIVGVLPAAFLVPAANTTGVVDGLIVEASVLEGVRALRPGTAMSPVIARLGPGVTVRQAQAEFTGQMRRLSAELPVATRLGNVRVQPLQTGVFAAYAPYLWLLVAAVGLVLMIACVNLATLFLARGRSRVREAAVRASLGASPARLMIGATTDAIVVCVGATAVALLVCWLASHWLVSLVPPFFRAFAVSPLDLRLVAATAAIALLCAVIAGLVPALSLRRVNVLTVLHRGDGPSRPSRLRAGSVLLAAEAGLCIVLVAGAAITVRNFLGMALMNPGFEAAHLYTVGFAFDAPDDGNLPVRTERVEAMQEIFRRTAGVERAAIATQVPFGAPQASAGLWHEYGVSGRAWGVGVGFFTTTGTSLLAGRDFAVDEISTNAPVAILNRRGADAIWRDVTPNRVLGRSLRTPDGVRTVIGVVEDIRSRPGQFAEPDLFVPISSSAAHAVWRDLTFEAVVRMTPDRRLDRTTLAAQFRQETGDGLVKAVQSVPQTLEPWLDQPRFQATVFGGLAAIALLVAMAGLYGMAAFDVARRRPETGIRLTLGASAAAVRRDVLATTARPVAAGSLAGLLVSWWSAQYLQSIVFDVNVRDPWMFVSVATLLLATAVAAAWLPARRAARTDPASVLKAQ